MKRIVLGCLLASLSFFANGLSAQQDTTGVIQNYEPVVYKAGTVIFSVCKDSNGILFFATVKGVLVYDGETFETILLDGNAETRTVEYDPITDKVFVGGYSEFGFLENDTTGTYTYRSLSSEIRKEHHFTEVWQILRYGSNIYFQAYEGIFSWDGEKTTFLDIRDSYLFDGDSVLYVSQFEGDFGILKDGKFEQMFTQELFANEAVFQVLPFDKERLILASTTYGLFLMDRNTYSLTSMAGEANDYFKKTYFYQAVHLKGDVYAATTWEGGIVVFELRTGNVLGLFDKDKGLVSNGMYDVEIDAIGNLWAVGEFGISKVDLNMALPDHLPESPDPKTLIRSVILGPDSLINPMTRSSFVINGDVESVGFNFSTPGFCYFQDNSYSYFLEGYDDEWSDWTSENTVSFAKLGNGTYTFHVKSRLGPDRESEIASFPFEISIPWYSWFLTNLKYLVTGLSIVLVGYFGLTYRLRRNRNILARRVAARTKELAKQKDELKKANENLIELNHELDNFIYRSSHDLIAPIKSIKGLVNIMKLAGDDKERDQYVELMKDRLDKLEDFISEINNYTKNEKKEVTVEEFNFREVIENTQMELSFYKGAPDIDLQLDIDKDFYIKSDRERWEMIINNLLTNSIKYHNIHQDHPYIRVAVLNNSNTLKFIIEDNGQGIQEEHLDKVFKMFYRAHESAEGSGLGLYLVKKTLEKMDGTISIDSIYGKGTRISIEVPSIKVSLPAEV